MPQTGHRWKILWVLLTFCGCVGDKDSAGDEAGATTCDPGDYVCQQMQLLCYNFANHVCYEIAADCGEPHTGPVSDCETQCNRDGYAACMEELSSLDDPSAGVFVASAACPNGVSPNYASTIDCNDDVVRVAECNGVAYADGWAIDISILDTCPCVVTGRVTDSTTYGETVCGA